MSLGLEHIASGPYIVFVGVKLAVLNLGLFTPVAIEVN